MTTIELCEHCATPTTDDDVYECEAEPGFICGDCFDAHKVKCSLCRDQSIDYDILRPGK